MLYYIIEVPKRGIPVIIEESNSYDEIKDLYDSYYMCGMGSRCSLWHKVMIVDGVMYQNGVLREIR